MSSQRYTPEFKDEAARQVLDRGYPVADVAEHPMQPMAVKESLRVLRPWAAGRYDALSYRRHESAARFRVHSGRLGGRHDRAVHSGIGLVTGGHDGQCGCARLDGL
ncbi:transposase [Salinisphaera sp. Q1T1-3]|uniref:transposase n=1 Tax=Salinisphaera sp. Q1T1-3 TaxID=2321229 RepID=UPI00351A528D